MAAGRDPCAQSRDAVETRYRPRGADRGDRQADLPAGDHRDRGGRDLRGRRGHEAHFYDQYLSDEAVAITPHGVFDRQAIIAKMSSPASTFASTGTDDVRAFVLSASSGVVTYRAHYPSGDVIVTTAYRLEDGCGR